MVICPILCMQKKAPQIKNDEPGDSRVLGDASPCSLRGRGHFTHFTHFTPPLPYPTLHMAARTRLYSRYTRYVSRPS